MTARLRPAAGLLDEHSVDIVAILLGSSVRRIDRLVGTPVALGRPVVIAGVGVTHLGYPVRRASSGGGGRDAT